MSPNLLLRVLAGLALFSAASGAPHLRARNAGSQVVTPCTSPFAPWNYVGCFMDLGNPSTLPFDTPGTSFNNMTVEFCIASCKGNGYRYAGLEYYGQCFCGDSINGQAASPSDCNAACTGNSSETCGGTSRISVWQDPTFPPANPSTIDDYVSLGCYTEASNNNRALIIEPALDPSTMTTEICLAACKNLGYPYAGTEYSQECYCGTFLNPGSVPTTSGQCNMPCNGNTSETCGGPRLLNLYYANDLVSTQPCGYVPPPLCTATGYGYTTTTSETFISLGIGSNWGWVIQGAPSITGTLYTGAGGNDLSKGTNVGSCTIQNVSNTLTITYTLTQSSCYLQTTHLFVGATYPSRIAPGKFGNTHTLAAGTTTDTFTFPYDPTNSTYILHADIACPCTS